MPIEQDPQEIYHCYQESQRRVELWVRSTTKELRELGIGLQVQQQAALPSTQLPSPPVSIPVPLDAKPHRAQLQPQGAGTEEAGHVPALMKEKDNAHGHPERSSSRPSSGSKPRKLVKDSAVEAERKHASAHTSQSTPAKSKSSSRSSRRRREAGSFPDRVSRDGTGNISSYLPYGVLPILYALTRSPALSIVAGVILLVGYLIVDFDSQGSKSSRKKS
ncbi:hypothetical protein D9613_007311 [Agrocybe pediades]|uniref:Uncharacterized protein n=1 Tax=Agrocybe pediades TaxID=84607 RepID=A0A8H4QGR7_9AGAR|nr:hypothetical protein D9613_007311 [Agrocybe pediades]